MFVNSSHATYLENSQENHKKSIFSKQIIVLPKRVYKYVILEGNIMSIGIVLAKHWNYCTLLLEDTAMRNRVDAS